MPYDNQKTSVKCNIGANQHKVGDGMTLFSAWISEVT